MIKKQLKKLIPTLFLMLIAASMVATSTFAWFTKNTSVTAKGMKVNIEVYDNLLVAPDEGTAQSSPESLFKQNYAFSFASTKIAAVSTVDAKTFFFIDGHNVTAAGNKITGEGEYIPYNETDFKARYDNAVGYRDFSFQLKAINGMGSSGEMQLRLTTLDLQYIGDQMSAVSQVKAFRAAVFTEEKTSEYPTESGRHVESFSSGHASVSSGGVLKSIYAPSDSINFTSGEAVYSSGTTAPVTYNAIGDDSYIASVADKSTKYFKVTIRLWLEGEDNTCNLETFVLLDDGWNLNVCFDLVPASDTAKKNVSELTISNYTRLVESGGTLEAFLTNGYDYTNFQWYRDGVRIDGARGKTFTPTEGGVYYCVIIDYAGKEYITPTYTKE